MHKRHAIVVDIPGLAVSRRATSNSPDEWTASCMAGGHLGKVLAALIVGGVCDHDDALVLRVIGDFSVQILVRVMRKIDIVHAIGLDHSRASCHQEQSTKQD